MPGLSTKKMNLQNHVATGQTINFCKKILSKQKSKIAYLKNCLQSEDYKFMFHERANLDYFYLIENYD